MSLWGSKKIPIIGGTGEIGSGKTLFGMTIEQDPAKVALWDCELSSASYEADFPGIKRVDLHGELIKKNPNGYSPEQLFVAWHQQVHKVEPGKFTVGMLDPASEIENGLGDWVWNNPANFGKTKAQFEKGGGIYWGCVKDYWKRILMELAVKFETFYFTVHLRQAFEGNTPIKGVKEPKGKSVLEEAASLYLWFERTGNSEVPSARVLKTRLCRRDEKGTLKSILPPRLQIATPAKIREYINNPADFNNLKAWEQARKQELSIEDQAALKIAVANAEKDAADAKRELAEAITRDGHTPRMVTTQAGEDVVVRATKDGPGGTAKPEATAAP